MEHLYAIFRVQMLRIGVGVFGNPEPFWAYVMDGTSPDHDGISRSPQQAHDEAVRRVETTDGCAAGMTLYLVADDPVKGGNEIRNNKRPLSGCCRKMQIPIVQLSQPLRERRFRVPLVAINDGPYEPHCCP